jgi:hypothetical protein
MKRNEIRASKIPPNNAVKYLRESTKNGKVGKKWYGLKKWHLLLIDKCRTVTFARRAEWLA